MSAIITTERLSLCRVSETDVSRLHALWALPAVRRYLWDDAIISASRARETVVSSMEDAKNEGLGLWTLRENAHPAGNGLIGFVALRHPEGSSEVELLYGLHPNVWGMGYATEASAALLEYAFNTLEIPRVIAGADLPNTGSFQVMERLGMTPFGKRIASAPDAKYFVMDKETWKPR